MLLFINLEKSVKAFEILCILLGVNNIRGKKGVKVPSSSIKYYIFHKFKVSNTSLIFRLIKIQLENNFFILSLA